MTIPTRNSRTTALLLAAATMTTLAYFTTPTQAIQPAAWTHTTEADFAGGDPVDTIVTNLGDIKLTSETTQIEGLPEGVTVIHDVVKMQNATYVAAGPEAKILKVTQDGVEIVAEYDSAQIFSITQHFKDQLLIGVSAGKETRIDELRDGELITLTTLPDVKYIWSLRSVFEGEAGRNGLLIATGLQGKVLYFQEGDGQVKTLLETAQANILSLATDTQGNIYAGTDTDGLVYRIDAEGNPFVVYDAPEAEVAAIYVADDGTVYAGTAAADQARPGRMAQPVDKETGRADEPEEAMPEDEVPAEEEPPAEEQPEDVAPEADADGDAVEAPAKPTVEQYDRLRDTMRQRLEQARETGEFDVAVDGAQPLAPVADNNDKPDRPSRAQPAAPAQRKQGNAVYQIDPNGFVREVFRESAMILAIAPLPDQSGKLLVTTGNEGQVFTIDPRLGESTLLTDLDSQQVTAAVQTDAGLLLAGANPAALVLLDQGLAQTGSYTSQVLDAGQISMFGTFKLTADIPVGCSVIVETRSGNVGDPETAAWSAWTEATTLEADPATNALAPREVKLDAPPARYLQYKLTLTSANGQTPTIDEVDLAYVSPNVPPQVTALNITVPTTGEPGSAHDPNIALQWQATDDNSDRITYTLEYRPAEATRYLPLEDGLTDTRYAWKTQHVPDGWYTVRVTASDALDNPADMAQTAARVSEPVLVDNSAPTLDGLETQVADGKVTLAATAQDGLSPIKSIAYSVDGSDEYQASLPQDLIYDSTSESWSATISDLSLGEHVVAVRVIDARGNTAYRQVIVTVD